MPLPPACRTPLRCLLAGLLLLPLHGHGQTTDGTNYLFQIEEEAKRRAATPLATETPSAPAALDSTERLPLGLQPEAFEKALQEQFVGTYVFYQRLTPEGKRQIFEIYQRDNRVGTIREQTLKLLSGATP